MKAYKVFEEKNKKPFFMFHGVCGTKEIPLDRFIMCERKRVRDGSGKRWYISGFHVYESKDVLLKFLSSLKKNRDTRMIVEIDVRSIKRKHENSRTHLADQIRITKSAWRKRKSVNDFLFREIISAACKATPKAIPFKVHIEREDPCLDQWGQPYVGS